MQSYEKVAAKHKKWCVMFQYLLKTACLLESLLEFYSM